MLTSPFHINLHHVSFLFAGFNNASRPVKPVDKLTAKLTNLSLKYHHSVHTLSTRRKTFILFSRLMDSYSLTIATPFLAIFVSLIEHYRKELRESVWYNHLYSCVSILVYLLNEASSYQLHHRADKNFVWTFIISITS